MRLIWGVLAVWPGLVQAQDWTPLRSDAEIAAALSDRILRYDAYTMQTFAADGETRFITERVSVGRWAARAGQYCSTWPPSDRWDCYDIQISGDTVRFIGSDRSTSDGTYAN